MVTTRKRPLDNRGFSLLELLVACIVLPLMVAGVVTSFNAVRRTYTTSRQLNEIYTVLSACPELDRALEFSSLTNTSNCYPNNSFAAENGGSATITYAPALTVTDTASLDASDPLKSIPDSKVVSISVGFPDPGNSAPPLQLRMLITRNGIGQQ
jgi:prepilin-type N-terminal cleavage/methylation domain-containing protein